MNWQDAIYLTQELAKTCRVPGLLQQTWGTHSLSSEGTVLPGRDRLSQRERDLRMDEYVRNHIPRLVENATPFFVDKELCAMIQRTTPTVPAEARLKPALFKATRGCLFFERYIQMPPRRLLTDPRIPNLPSHEPAPLSGFAWEHDENGVVFVHFYAWAADTSTPSWHNGVYIGNIPLAVTPWQFASSTLGTHVAAHNREVAVNPNEDDHNNADRFDITARATVATLLLMDQVLTVIDTTPVDRYARKRAVKAGWTQEPTVQVVKLRKVDKVNLYEHTRDVQWTCRWQVSEHWRTLKRGTPDERTVLVHAYMKGPPGLPVKPPNFKVFGVVR